MQSYENKSKIPNLKCKIELLSHIGFLLAIGVSAWFFNLRTTFGESSMMLFNLINEPDFFTKTTWLSWNWFQNLMTILAVKSNLSLSLVSIVFSASPMVFMYGVFWITNYVFKQKYSGVLLLLLLLGVNQTFFGAVHTLLISLTTLYLVMCGIRAILKENESQLDEMVTWAMLCLIVASPLIAWAPPNVYGDATDGIHHFSFMGYFWSITINTFIIPFIMMTYLVILWIYRKEFGKLAYSIFWVTAMLLMIFFRGADGLLSTDFEQAIFPLIASFVGFFVIYLENETKLSATKSASLSSQTRFWIISSLVILAVFGQLRTLPKFIERQDNVVRLLQHAPKTGDMFAIPEHFQQLERYVDPTYLALETPLITSFRGLPIQSAFFLPTDTTVAKRIPRISKNTLNSTYFNFLSPDYLISNEPFINRTQVIPVYQEEKLNRLRDTTVVMEDGIEFALTTILDLRRGDSVYLSVYRNGSEFGHLVISDNLRINTRLWSSENYGTEADTEEWIKLSKSIIIEKTDKHKVYVMNRNQHNDRIEFKNLSIEIWRE